MKLINFRTNLVFICCIIFVSCKPLITKVDKINKVNKYNNKNEYVLYYSHKLGIEKEKIFFFKRQVDLYSFFDNLRENRLTFFYGIKENDKLYRLDSNIKTNSCLSLINSVVLKEKQQIGDILALEFDLNNSLLENSFKKEPVFDQNIVIFILSDRLGETNLKSIKSIIKGRNYNTDYLLISVDDYFL